MSRHSNVSCPDLLHSVGCTHAATSWPSVRGPAASSTAVDVEILTLTSASLSRRVKNWVDAPARRLIWISCPSTQMALVRSM